MHGYTCFLYNHIYFSAVSSIPTAGVWSCPATTGKRPPPCSAFTFTAVDDRRAVVFGGRNIKQGRMNDVYIIDFHTMVYKIVGTWLCPLYNIVAQLLCIEIGNGCLLFMYIDYLH